MRGRRRFIRTDCEDRGSELTCNRPRRRLVGPHGGTCYIFLEGEGSATYLVGRQD